MTDRLSPEREAEIAAIAERAAADPFYLSDCEGSLQVWRESALVRVVRDEHGTITGYSLPFAFPPADQVIEIDLDSWDPGEDAVDDQRRQDIGDLVEARAALNALLAELAAVRAERDEARARVAAVDRLSLPEKLKVDTIAPEYRNGYVHALADMREAWIALAMEVSNPQCTAEYGGPGYTHCELPAGHEGQHASAIGNMRRATWGGGR